MMLHSSEPFSDRAKRWVHRYRTYLLLFGGALLVRLLVFALYHADFWYKTCLIDDCLYFSWAHEILGGDVLGLKKGVFRMNPGYPYTLSVIYFLFAKASYSPHIVQYILGAFSAVLMAILTTRMFGKRVGMGAGILQAIYGMAVFYEGKLLGPVWINFINMLMLYFLLRWKENHVAWFLFVAGAMLGLSSLYLPTVLLFVPGALIWIAISPYNGNLCAVFLPAVRHGLLFLCGVGCLMVPVMLRNMVVDRSFGLTLTTSSGGVNFYIGNNPEANGYNSWPSFIRYSPDSMHSDFKDEAQRRTGSEMTDSEVSSYWFGESITWLLKNPSRALWLYKKKCMYFWNAVEPPDNFMMDSVKKFTRIYGIPLLGWGVIAPFALFALYCCFRERKGLLIILYLTSYFGSNLLFYILSRYRFPAVVAVIPLAAFAAVWLYDRFKARAWKTGSIAVAVLIVLFVFVHQEVVRGEVLWTKHYSVGVIYNNRGRVAEAIQEYKRSIALNPQFAPSRINLANIYLEKKEYATALEHYLVAATLQPKDAAELYRISGDICLYYLNEYEPARRYLTQGADRGSRAAHQSLGELALREERYRDAVRIFTDYNAKNPGDYLVEYKLGLAYYHQKDFSAAYTHFSQSLALKPDFQDARGAIAHLEGMRKQ